jgi:hypothetical protein
MKMCSGLFESEWCDCKECIAYKKECERIIVLEEKK